jgi:hypothetical protein
MEKKFLLRKDFVKIARRINEQNSTFYDIITDLSQRSLAIFY